VEQAWAYIVVRDSAAFLTRGGHDHFTRARDIGALKIFGNVPMEHRRYPNARTTL
jgi:hypothetical protein